MTRQDEKLFRSVPRGSAIMVGVICLGIALTFAIFATLLVWRTVQIGSFDRKVGIVCGVLVFFTLAFAGLGWRYCRNDPQNTAISPITALHKHNKYNDADWCLGVFGIIGGGLMIFLDLADVATLIAKHFQSFFAVCFFVIGIQSYLTWRWKRKYEILLSEFDRSVESVTTTLAEMSAELGNITKAQRDDPSNPHSPSAQGADGR